MNIYVHSAGFVEDYSRRQPAAAPALPREVREWQALLDKNDARFALVAGCTGGSWYIEFRNLVLPGRYDMRNRQIVLNICFGALQSEAQVRALALAYLDFEMVYHAAGHCTGRLCPGLATAYREQAGDYDFDFAAARQWAEGVMAHLAPLPAEAAEMTPIICHTNPELDSYTEQVRQQLLTHRLRERDGLRLLWAELDTDPACGADITLQYTEGKGCYKTLTAPVTRPARRGKTLLLLSGLAILLIVILYYLLSAE